MKTLLSILLLSCFCSLAHAGTPKSDSLSCLDIEGKILNAADGSDAPCKIELWTSSGVVDTAILKTGKNKFHFILKRNSYYTIRIVKQGFVDKLVCVDTALPPEEDITFRFRFDTSLMEIAEAKEVNRDALDFPVAIIHYQLEEECFNYNEIYTRKLRDELYATNHNGAVSKR